MDEAELARANKAVAEHEKFKASVKTFHLPVVNLSLPTQCEVGHVTFRPSSGLDALITEAIKSRPDLSDGLRRRGGQWATADVRAVTFEDARGRATDAIGVLRLYQRTRYRYVSLDRQTFGLTSDVGHSLEEYWTSHDGKITGTGFQTRGILSDWTFTESDITAFAETSEFAVLHQALRAEENALDDIQRRCLIALRIANQATRMLAPAIRAVLFAVAVESLLGQPEANQTRESNRAHRVSARYAYLTCDVNMDGSGLHGLTRLACIYLVALHQNQDWLIARLRERFPEGGGVCSAYFDCDELMERRNALLHEGLQWEGPGKPESLEGRFDKALLALIRWKFKTRAEALTELDTEIDQLCAMTPELPVAR